VLQQATLAPERKIISVLQILSESAEPMGSTAISRELKRRRIGLSERSVRYYLRTTDEKGFTVPMGRDGRMITAAGLEEMQLALAPVQVSLMRHRLELLAFHTTFDPIKRSGAVPINTSFIREDLFTDALGHMRGAFAAGLCVSDLVATARECEKLGDMVIPKGQIGLATICSVVFNGVLLKMGVPMESKFGGVLEIEQRNPKRFVSIIDYAGTSLDPSEQYIRAGMTSVGQASSTGRGRILANFRELPGPANSIVEEVIPMLKNAGIGGVFAVGNPSEQVCQISVGLSRFGLILLGGLNPMAAVAEAGIEVQNIGESGIIDYRRLVSFRTL